LSVIAPPNPASSSVEHGIGGAPGLTKIASPFPTVFPSPQTEQPPSCISGHCNIDGVNDCDGCGVMLGLRDLGSQSLHSQISIRSGSKLQSLSVIAPPNPASSSVEHGIGGAPGLTKIASPFPTVFPSPQTEQPPSCISGHCNIDGVNDCDGCGVMLGLRDLGSQSLHSQIPTRSGNKIHWLRGTPPCNAMVSS